jgi:hypothetical protein
LDAVSVGKEVGFNGSVWALALVQFTVKSAIDCKGVQIAIRGSG